MTTKEPRLLLIKAHVSAYTRKDGTFVPEHDDKRIAAAAGVPHHSEVKKPRPAKPRATKQKQAEPSPSKKPRVTETEAFKNWFGDSKVVGSDGKPMVVYHGTAHDFDAFDKGKVGAIWGSDKSGFFFSSDASTAGEYADFASKQSGGGANVIPAYVNIRNPMTLDEFTRLTNAGLRPRHGEGTDSLTRFFDDFREEILHHAKAGKHDGVIFERDGAKLVVAFRPEQIKSAVGNNGNFDPNEASLTKAVLVIFRR